SGRSICFELRLPPRRASGAAVVLVGPSAVIRISACRLLCYHRQMERICMRRTRAGINSPDAAVPGQRIAVITAMAAPLLRRGLFAALVLMSAVSASAQEGAAGGAAGDVIAQPQEPGVFDRIGNWFDRQFSSMKTDLEKAGDSFNRDTRRTMQ